MVSSQGAYASYFFYQLSNIIPLEVHSFGLIYDICFKNSVCKHRSLGFLIWQRLFSAIIIFCVIASIHQFLTVCQAQLEAYV